MHALSHSLAHRAPPASRTRMRWQPYSALPQQVPPRSPAYPNTPASSISSSSASTVPLCEFDRPKQFLTPLPQPPKDGQLRDPQKNKYILGLVDQAVKTLCEIWPSQDIPSVFLVTSQASVSVALTTESLSNMVLQPSPTRPRNMQLPSPLLSSTSRSLVSSQSFASSSSSSSSLSSRPSSDSGSLNGHSRSNLIPIRGFVHEVLKRSRTSGSVLQTALCYLEAIRSKVPELVRREHLGQGTRGEPDLTDRIIQGEIEPNPDAFTSVSKSLESAMESDKESVMDCLPLPDITPNSVPSASKLVSESNSNMLPQQDQSRRAKPPSPPLTPLPSLPSPLLCPRRAFLASLILASKFTQDKCYSNRAWAKLSGLPPREIGRCERALGDALEWRLWVGKAPSAATSTSASPVPSMHGNVRTVVRCQSDGDLLAGSKLALARKPQQQSTLGHWNTNMAAKTHGTLIRSTTLPATAFAETRVPMTMSTMLCRSTESTNDPPSGYGTSTITNVSEPSSRMAIDPLEKTDMLCDSPGQMATPTLTHSPSSTESSSGDRTIHMASFIDEPQGVFGASGCFTVLQEQHKVSPPMGDGIAGYPFAVPFAPTNPAHTFRPEKYCDAYCVAHYIEPTTDAIGRPVFTQ